MNEIEIKDLLKQICETFGLPYDLSEKQIEVESNFNPNAYNNKTGASGLGQFLESTYLEILPRAFQYNFYKGNYTLNIFDPYSNLLCYGYYMGKEIPKLLSQFGFEDTWENRLRAYNAGIGNLEKSYNFPETNNYVAMILGKKKTSLNLASLSWAFIVPVGFYFLSKIFIHRKIK